MLYLVIGLFVVMAVGAFFRQQSKQTEPENQDVPPINPESLDFKDDEAATDNGENTFVLSAKPLTSPDLASGATYSAHAPAGEESPYGIQKRRPRPKLIFFDGADVQEIFSLIISPSLVPWPTGQTASLRRLNRRA